MYDDDAARVCLNHTATKQLHCDRERRGLYMFTAHRANG